MTASAVYEGWIRHRRFEPVEHEFRYRFFLMYLDLAELPQLLDPYPLWSARRAAPARFRRADFMGDPDRPLEECARDAVEAETGARPAGPVRLLAGLRYLGHSFNPVSFYYCFDSAGRAGRGGRGRRREHPLGRASCLCPRPRRARGHGADRRARQDAPRLPADGDGPDLRLPRQRARRAARRPHRVAARRRAGRQVLRRDPLAAPPRAEPAAAGADCWPATRRCRCRWWRRSTPSRCG